MKEPYLPRVIPSSLRRQYNVRGGFPTFKDRLNKRLPCTIGFFGSSQTANRGWAERTFALLREKYPAAQLHYENISQGGVSMPVASRFVLSKVIPLQPHLLFMEYTPAIVYSGRESDISYLETALRDVKTKLPDCDICYVHCCDRTMIETLFKINTYPAPAEQIESLLEHYAISSVNFVEEIFERMEQETLIYDSKHFHDLLQTHSREQLRSREHYSVDGHPVLGVGDELCAKVMREALPECVAADKIIASPLPSRITPEIKPQSLEDLFSGFSDDTLRIADLGRASGHIPDLSRFVQLQQLDLRGCVVENEQIVIPALPDLEIVNMELCEIAAPFPQISTNTTLRVLVLSQNKMHGVIPDLSPHQELMNINLGHNCFETIAPIWNLPAASFVDISNNKLTGLIPDFSKCQNLSGLFLDRNCFSGTMPDFSMLPLVSLFMYSCQLQAYTPGSLKIPSLIQFSAAYNPLGLHAVRQMLEDLVEISNSPNCATKTISLENTCEPTAIEHSLAAILRTVGWTVRLAAGD